MSHEAQVLVASFVAALSALYLGPRPEVRALIKKAKWMKDWPPPIPKFAVGDVVYVGGDWKTIIRGFTLTFDERRGGWETPQYWYDGDGDAADDERNISRET